MSPAIIYAFSSSNPRLASGEQPPSRALASHKTLLCAETMVISGTSELYATFPAAERGRQDPAKYLLAMVRLYIHIYAQNMYQTGQEWKEAVHDMQIKNHRLRLPEALQIWFLPLTAADDKLQNCVRSLIWSSLRVPSHSGDSMITWPLLGISMSITHHLRKCSDLKKYCRATFLYGNPTQIQALPSHPSPAFSTLFLACLLFDGHRVISLLQLLSPTPSSCSQQIPLIMLTLSRQMGFLLALQSVASHGLLMSSSQL